MKFWIGATLLMTMTACSSAKFGGAPSSQQKSSLNSEADNGDGAAGSVVQPSEPAPGDAQTPEQAQCKYLASIKPYLTPVADGSSLSSSLGNSLLKGYYLKEIKDFTGNVVFFGTQAGAHIDTISGVMGNVIICYADVGELIDNSTGNVIVVGGKIGVVKDFTGNVIAGQLGDISNSTGNAVAGQVGDVNGYTGNILTGQSGSVSGLTGNLVNGTY